MFLQNFHIRRVKKTELFKVATFIVDENYNHHQNQTRPSSSSKEVLSVFEEELAFFPKADFFSIWNFNELLGAIRVLEWDFKSILPIQKLFGINPLNCIVGEPLGKICHIGRFAIKKGNQNLTLFKTLMVCAIAPVCESKNNLAFAECDAKLLRALNRLGIKTRIIGDSIEYLGSETIPICMTCEDLLEFYLSNRGLLGKTTQTEIPESQLPKSVVFNTVRNNYTSV